MKELMRFLKKTVMHILLLPILIFPIKRNQVLLINNLALKYSGNPKYLAEYLRKYYKGEFRLVYAAEPPTNMDVSLKKEVHFVHFNSIKYFYYAMTSRVLITNSGGFSYIPLRKQQYVINTWHGGGAYKKVGIHMYNNSWLFRKDLLLSAKKTDVFLSSSRKFTEIMTESMLIPKDIFWEIGMPRNDMLLQNDREFRNQIRMRLGLRDEEKLVLFAPTYRKPQDDYFRESIAISYGLDASRVCRALERRFGGNWRFAIRLHPRVVNRQDVVTEGMLDLTDYEDMQELLLAADVMINDFSSSLWDFMLTGKPTFMFATDIERYVNTTQVYTPLSEWPFPKAANNDELEENIIRFDAKEYKAACEKHYRDLGGCETGQAVKFVGKRIHELCFESRSH